MAIDRTTIITGPCVISYAGQKFWSKGDVGYKLVVDRFAVETSAFGEVDGRVQDKRVEVSFEPDGRFTAGLAAILWPYASMAIGASVFGATDTPMVINGSDGVQLTLPNAALTAMPNLRASVGKTTQASVTFTGLLKNNTAPETAGAYYAISSASYPGNAGWASSDILTLAYQSEWGSTAPWNNFKTEDGWEINFGLQLASQKVDGLGTVDMTLQSLSVEATAIPVGPSLAAIHTAMHENQKMGSSMAGSDDLVISSTGLYASLSNAGMADMNAAWGAQSKRLGACKFMAHRSVTEGVADPLFYIGTAAPV